MNQFMQLAIEGMSHDSASLRECSYCFFSVVARVFGNDFAPYLTLIMPRLIQSCQIEDKDFFEIESMLNCYYVNHTLL
jgi:hypothetical protein